MPPLAAAIPAPSRAPPAPPSASSRRVAPGALRQAAAASVSALACLAADAAVMALLAGTYTAKRRLDIDVFPGRDVLPDVQVEAVIRAVAGLVRWYL